MFTGKIGKGKKRMKRFAKKKWVVTAGIAVLAIAALIVSTMNAGTPVETATVEPGEVQKVLKETGTVESVSSVMILAQNSGAVRGLVAEEGDSVKAGDVLMAGIGTSATLGIKSGQAQLAGLQVEYNRAKEQAGKDKVLYESGAISYREYNASEAAAEQLAAQVEALRYSIRGEAEASSAGGVTATVGGVITGVFVKEGESVSVGEPLFEISDLNDIYIKTDFIADDADLIHVGDAVKIYNKDNSFNDEDGSVKKVHLKAENKMSDLGVNQKRVTVEIAFGAPATVRLGSDMNVEIIVDQKENTLRIPGSAVFEKNHNDCVYVVAGGKAILREIETGLEGEDFTEVVSGLPQGDIVILSPGDAIADGVRVKTQH